MSTIAEIEAAIENLPEPLVDELAVWFEKFRTRRGAPFSIDAWLESATGAAIPGVTTGEIMNLTRGEE